MIRNLLSLSFLVSVVLAHAQAPTADFTAAPLSTCVGTAVSFNSTSTTNGGPAITQYSWNFGDGVTVTTNNPSHVYTTPGTYTITLVVTNANGGVDSEVKPNYITILPAPNVAFSVSGLGCTVPLTVGFNNTSSSGANFTYAWNFGNGQNSNLQNPANVTYNAAGTYGVQLTVTNTTTGCTASYTDSIVVSNFQAGITAPATGCVGSAVTFQDNSTAGANQWNWNFDGQGNSNQQNPSFTFNAPGVYNVTLQAQNSGSNCSGNAQHQIVIQNSITPSFTASPLTNCAPSTVTFVNTTGVAGNYTWNFGNGQTYTGTTPPPQVYTTGGQYSVTLSVNTASGCTGSTTQNNYINIVNITAGFEADETGGCDPHTVNFTDTSSSPNPANPIVSWQWNFGNGQTFNGQNPPPQTYGLNPGLYDVTLVVTSQSGCIDTMFMNDYITVGHIDLVDFTVSPLVTCAKQNVNFTNGTVITVPHQPNEVSYFWDFGDGTSTQEDPTHQFTQDTGYISVQLVVDFRGCKDSITIDSAVYVLAPIAKFTPSTQLVCNPAGFPVNITFTDNAIHGELPDNVNMTWEWGDGTPNTNIGNAVLDGPNNGNTSHSFAGYGSYTVEQVVRNFTTGCSDSITKAIHISQIAAQFTRSNDSVCRWSYAMGNGQTVTTGPNPTYVYTTQGLYNITLTVTNSVGCTAQMTHPVRVLNVPFPIITALDAVGCSPFPVTFTNGSMAVGNGMPLSYFVTTFSDDNSSVTTNNVNQPINHTFVGNGVYLATMIAYDQFGCESTPATVPVTITKPTANFTFPSVVCFPDTNLTVNSSTGVGNLTYEWYVNNQQVGTGTDTSITSVLQPNLPAGQISSTFNLSLVAIDSNGCEDTLTQAITVSLPHAIPTYTFSGAVLNANGEYDCPPLFASYVDSSQSVGNITAWDWQFGDGNNSTLEDPSNTFVVNGNFDLYLSVTDQYGCVDDTTILDYVAIGGPQGDPIALQNGNICAQGAAFVVQNPVDVDSVFWDMGDGTYVYNETNFVYNYETPGTYVATVTIMNQAGCAITTVLDSVTVFDDGLNANFSASPVSVEQNDVITLDDLSSFLVNPIVNWTWSVGNDTLNSVNNGADQYFSAPISGNYTITLTVVDNLGCEDDYSLMVTVIDPVLSIPNVVTPNGDGINDELIFSEIYFKNYSVEIFNRWGHLVYTIEDQTGIAMWDAATSDGTPVTDGVYFYRVVGEMLAGTPVDSHGFVTVIGSK
ncbi:MAG: PKD domain-containing protein [Flavobacteriia bacterium]|nr:PKD domain-containing protein [Flavobacteriia bacterium]